MGSGEHQNFRPDCKATRIDVGPTSLRHVLWMAHRPDIDPSSFTPDRSPELEAGLGVNRLGYD